MPMKTVYIVELCIIRGILVPMMSEGIIVNNRTRRIIELGNIKGVLELGRSRYFGFKQEKGE